MRSCFKIFGLLTLLNSVQHLWGQVPDFRSPVDHNIVLAGNFGEIRATHFHAGIDIKPSAGVDQIKAIYDGYVSRIKVDRGGYGRAVYIDHPNGYTSVYAHLDNLSPKIKEAVSSLQQANKSYEIEIYPEPGTIMFEKGEIIGTMGNSGRSYGKHLHFEIRQTATEAPLNPFAFGIKPTDNIPPTISGIVIHSLDANYDILSQQLFSPSGLPTSIKVAGSSVGVAIGGYDKMNGASNSNGIYEISLLVNEQLYYYQVMDSVYFHEMNQIKCHIDYAAKINKKATYARLYKLPGNGLNIVKTAENNGVIPLSSSVPVNITIIAKDFHGNEVRYSTALMGSSESEALYSPSFNHLATPEKESTFKSQELHIDIPADAVSKPEMLTIQTIDKIYKIGRKDQALINPAKLYVKMDPKAYQTQQDKLILALSEDGDFVDYGTKVEGDMLFAEIESFGNYTVIVDNTAPTIRPTAYPKPKGAFYHFDIRDNVETKGNAVSFKYEVYINGIWTPCELKSLHHTLYVPVGTPNDEIEIITRDQKGNTRMWTNK